MANGNTRVDVAVIGAGQAGLSLSAALREHGVEHLVLEKGRIAESWQSQRWDSFCLVTPNWSVQLAGLPYAGTAPDSFLPRDDLVAYLNDYAAQCGDIWTGVEVTHAAPRDNGWALDTAAGERLRARHLVIATGTYQVPKTPAMAASATDVFSLHSAHYRNPSDLPSGDVLVVGSGQSGAQIAAELNNAGRRVTLATSRIGDIPRHYRGRDIITWQRELGWLDRHWRALDDPGHRFNHDPILSGRAGQEHLSLRNLAARGIQLAGRLNSLDAGRASFDRSLADNIRFGDAFRQRTLRAIDQLIQDQSLSAPAADESTLPHHAVNGPRHMRLGGEHIQSIVWATGYERALDWLDAPVFGAGGHPEQTGWETAAPNLHFLGFNYVEHRRSGILYGAGREAESLASHIASGLGAH